MNTDEKAEPDFNKRGGLIIAIAQDYKGKVLMQAYMNQEAWEETQRTGKAVYWSTERGELWPKGATSGCEQIVKGIELDCDGDSVLLTVEQLGSGACHKGYYSCFYRRIM